MLALSDWSVAPDALVSGSLDHDPAGFDRDWLACSAWSRHTMTVRNDASSVMVLPFRCCLAGRSALPLEPRDGGHRGTPQGRRGQAVKPTKSAIDQDRRPWVGSGAGLVGGGLAAGDWACQHRPAISLHPGVAGERGSHHEGHVSARSRPLAMSLARLSPTSQNPRWRSPPDAWPVVAGWGVIERTTR
jgi:hypothetical protein